MTNKLLFNWRRWLTWIMASVLVISLATWYFSRDTLPPTIVIGTAVEGGMYHEMGGQLSNLLREQTRHEVVVEPTTGSRANADFLRDGDIHVAIVQAGTVDMTDLAVVTPLHHDVVVVLVRRGLKANDAMQSQVKSVAQLAGKRVIVGRAKSGMRASAADVLEHYGVDQQVIAEEVHFSELLEDEGGQYDAAIVTTGLEAKNLGDVLATGEFDILPLDARALERRYAHFHATEIPAKLWPPLPDESVPTVHTQALLVVRRDASAKLVGGVLDCLNDHEFRRRFPTLIRESDTSQVALAQLHPAARRYHDPLYGFSWLAASLESIAAGRELIVALAAGIFLAWDRWRRMRDHARQARIDEQKARLTAFLERTLDIEKQQMNVTDIEQLNKFLDDVTQIKLRALDELSHEELQDHRAFSIFLMQCANLISKIQLKIMHYTSGGDDGAG